MPKRSIGNDGSVRNTLTLSSQASSSPAKASSWIHTLLTNDLATIRRELPCPTPHQFALALEICDAPVIRWMQKGIQHFGGNCSRIKNLDVYLALDPHQRPTFNWSEIVEWTYESRKAAIDMFGPPTLLHPAFAELDWSYMDKTSPKHITRALAKNDMDAYDWLCRAGAAYPSDALVTISLYGTFASFKHVMATKNLLLVNARKILESTRDREIFDFVDANGRVPRRSWNYEVHCNVLRNRWYDMEDLLHVERVSFNKALEFGWTRLAVRVSYNINGEHRKLGYITERGIRNAADAFDEFPTAFKFLFLMRARSTSANLDYTVPFILEFTKSIMSFDDLCGAVYVDLTHGMVASYLNKLSDARILLQRWWDRTHTYLDYLTPSHERVLLEVVAERSREMLKAVMTERYRVDAWGYMFPHLHAHFIVRYGLRLFREKFHEWKLWRLCENHWPEVWCDLETPEKQMILDTVRDIPFELVDSEDLVPQRPLPDTHPLAAVVNPKVWRRQRFRLLGWRACTVMHSVE